MDKHFNVGHRGLYAKFSNVLSSLSVRVSKTTTGDSRKRYLDATKLKQSRGLILIFLSFLFGWLSLSLTEESAVQKYRLTQWPVQAVWNSTLKQLQLMPRPNLGDYSSILQSHPEPFTGEVVLWMNEDACILYLPQSPYAQAAELWTCAEATSTTKVKKWIKVGSGHDAFERVVAFLQKNPKKPLVSAHPSRNIVDPREIRY